MVRSGKLDFKATGVDGPLLVEPSFAHDAVAGSADRSSSPVWSDKLGEERDVDWCCRIGVPL